MLFCALIFYHRTKYVVALKPYLCKVQISDMVYGSGIGSSKKNAKMEACKEDVLYVI